VIGFATDDRQWMVALVFLLACVEILPSVWFLLVGGAAIAGLHADECIACDNRRAGRRLLRRSDGRVVLGTSAWLADRRDGNIAGLWASYPCRSDYCGADFFPIRGQVTWTPLPYTPAIDVWCVTKGEFAT